MCVKLTQDKDRVGEGGAGERQIFLSFKKRISPEFNRIIYDR
jgi:hypothetical protein